MVRVTKPGGTVQIVDRDWGLISHWAQSPEEVQRWNAMITLARSDWGTDAPAYRQMWAALFEPDATPSDLRLLAENERKSMTAGTLPRS